jgi:hypothetical protein
MSFADALVSLAKSQRRIAGKYATELRTGLYPWRAENQRAEVIRLRAAAREHLEWARRERQWTQREQVTHDTHAL